MIRRTSLQFAPLALGILALALPAHAATFDLIYADHLQVTTFSSNTGFTLAGADIGLVVNKGATNIDGPEFFGATFAAASSNPLVQAIPFINNPGPPIMPVLPNQAIGSVDAENNVLTTKLVPGETLHNTSPSGVITIQVVYPPGFAGSVAFNISMTMGANVAHYTILADFTLGGASFSDFRIVFASAARVSSVPLATPAQATTWGAIKRLYH